MATEKRLIDAEPIKKFIVDGLNNPDLKKAFGHDAIEILTEIEYAPTVDAVEVIYCKDCARCKKGYCTIRKDSWGATLQVGLHDFCSDAERRADNGKID